MSRPYSRIPPVSWRLISTKLSCGGGQGGANWTRLIWRWIDAHGRVGIVEVHTRVHCIEGSDAVAKHWPAAGTAIVTLLSDNSIGLRTLHVMTTWTKAGLVVIEVIDEATVANGTMGGRTGDNTMLRHGLRMHHRSRRHALSWERHSGVEWARSSSTDSRLAPDVDGLVELLLLTRRRRNERRTGSGPVVVRQMVVEIGSGIDVGSIREVVEIVTRITQVGSSKGGSLGLR